MRKLAPIGLLVAACAGTRPARSPDVRVAPDVRAAPVRDDHAGFKAVARECALGLSGAILGWGSERMAPGGGSRDYAVLRYHDSTDHDAYLIEAAPGAYWLLEIERPAPGMVSDLQPWVDSPGSVMQLHDLSTGEVTELAIRGDRPVIVAHRFHHDADVGQPATDQVDPIAPDGEPADAPGSPFRVVGPEPDADAIVAAVRALR